LGEATGLVQGKKFTKQRLRENKGPIKSVSGTRKGNVSGGNKAGGGKKRNSGKGKKRLRKGSRNLVAIFFGCWGMCAGGGGGGEKR